MADLMTGQDALIARLEDENARLRRELAAKDEEIKTVESQNASAVKNLRRALNPLYTALQQVFGEINVIVSPEEAETPLQASPVGGGDARTKAIWDSWKRKMGAAAPVIDALLLQPEMTQTQIAIAIGRARTTVPALIYKLKQAGLIEKRGDRYSLKAL